MITKPGLVRKIALIAFWGLFSLFPLPSFAQFTTVSATVTDPNGIPYANGTISAILVPNVSGSYTLNGTPYSGRLAPTLLDSTGSVTVRMGDNSVLLPAGSQWLFTVQSNLGGVPPPFGAGTQSFTSTITISGGSQSISTTLSAAAPALTRGGSLTPSGTTVSGANITFPGSITSTSDDLFNGISFGLGTGQELTNLVIGAGAFNTINPGGGGITNLAIGRFALRNLTTGHDNLCIGYRCGVNESTGNDNVGLGNYALQSASQSGGGNTCIGDGTCYADTTGNNNTTVGSQSMGVTVDGANNVGVGIYALGANVSGMNNTAIGSNALFSSLASGVTAIGYDAGYTDTPANANTTGANDTWVGYFSGPATAAQVSNSCAFGYLAKTTNSNECVIGNSSVADVYLGSETPAAKVHSASYATGTDCAVNSVSPAACGAACAGAFVVPTTTTTYTVNTTCPTTNTSHIFLFPRTDNSGLPSAPTCVAVTVTSSVDRSAHVNNTSFTFILPSTTGTTCWDYWIISN